MIIYEVYAHVTGEQSNQLLLCIRKLYMSGEPTETFQHFPSFSTLAKWLVEKQADTLEKETAIGIRFLSTCEVYLTKDGELQLTRPLNEVEQQGFRNCLREAYQQGR